MRVTDPKRLGSLQRGTSKVEMLISERQTMISSELWHEYIGRVNYRNKEQLQICQFVEVGLEQTFSLPGKRQEEKEGMNTAES